VEVADAEGRSRLGWFRPDSRLTGKHVTDVPRSRAAAKTTDLTTSRLGTRDIGQLVADLSSDDPLRRAAAVARLRVAGVRAFPHVHALIQSTAPPAVRAAAVDALDGVGDARAAQTAVACLKDPDTRVVAAALGVLRAWVTHEDGTQVLDAVTALALDPERDAAVRRAAVDTLSDLPRHIVDPIAAQTLMAGDATPLSVDAEQTRSWVSSHGAAPLSTLHAIVTRSREQEQRGTTADRQAWLLARGAAHAALARRGSRVALYDLREAFETATDPLPVDFLAALETIGDASCLEPLARAWTAARGETWWRDRLAAAAGAIITREKLTRRHAAVKRVHARWPGFLVRI
jgi:HEAT repeat protein